MIGEQKFTVIEDGACYRLSDGTMLDFLSRDNKDGVTNEELIGVLLHRLKHQGKQLPCKETSRVITTLESCEEILWRRDITRGLEKRIAFDAGKSP